MKLANFPELKETYVDEKLFTERQEELPKVTRAVEAAKKYFGDLSHKRSMKEDFTIKDINPGHVYMLDQCISFAENKRAINDKIGKNVNDDIYHSFTGSYAYTGTLNRAITVTQAVLNPTIYDGIVEKPSMGENIYLTRDTLEQAYRICDYVLAYLKGYIKDPRLQNQVEESKSEIVKNLN